MYDIFYGYGSILESLVSQARGQEILIKPDRIHVSAFLV